ncbi:flagellar hook-length control protein FliK [Acuticoccus mangrovi]|uniref:Flagellar hook-length control protein FliK n=1 Tax=Acuticoccus mangrovi TaxID=2796142 RepID=A0A934IVB5_9HYPH|nr:flagellar hook-length control protein FliK [Acuticoccus mangrovi]MBJ3778695.1 flagellar hook-length control protein FliK [Acuticoccus mangrovi]
MLEDALLAAQRALGLKPPAEATPFHAEAAGAAERQAPSAPPEPVNALARALAALAANPRGDAQVASDEAGRSAHPLPTETPTTASPAPSSAAARNARTADTATATILPVASPLPLTTPPATLSADNDAAPTPPPVPAVPEEVVPQAATMPTPPTAPNVLATATPPETPQPAPAEATAASPKGATAHTVAEKVAATRTPLPPPSNDRHPDPQTGHAAPRQAIPTMPAPPAAIEAPAAPSAIPSPDGPEVTAPRTIADAARTQTALPAAATHQPDPRRVQPIQPNREERSRDLGGGPRVVRQETHFAPVMRRDPVEGPILRTSGGSAGERPALPQSLPEPNLVIDSLKRALSGLAKSFGTPIDVASPAPSAVQSTSPAAPPPAPSSTTAAPAPTPTPDGPVRIIELQLQPASLGTLTVTMRLSPVGLRVTLSANSRETAQRLTEERSELTEAIRRAGYAGVEVSVEEASAAQSHGGDTFTDTGGSSGGRDESHRGTEPPISAILSSAEDAARSGRPFTV